MTKDAKAAQPLPRRQRTNLGWAIQGACLLVFVAGFLAEQAGWIRFESSWIYAALLGVMGAAWILEGIIDRRISRVNEAEQVLHRMAAPRRRLAIREAPRGRHR